MLSVIVPVLNAESTLDQQLEALSQQRVDEEWELIVADNGSTDRSREIATSWLSRMGRLRVVDASARRGPSAARNIGAEQARGDLLLFCDADDVVGREWVAAFARARTNWDLAGGAIDYSSLNPPGAAPAGLVLPGSGQLHWLRFVAAANLAVHRAAFEAIGGFAEQFLRAQDVDFCWRAQLAGYSFGTVPEAVVAKRTRTDPRILYREHARWGCATVDLFLRYRAVGMSRPSLIEALRTYAWLALRLPKLGTTHTRREWARLAGTRWGRLRASVRNGTLCL